MSFYMFIKSKPKKCGIQVWDAADVNSCYAYNMQVTLARVMKQGRTSWAFELSNMRSVTRMEPEEVLPLIIYLHVANL